MTVEQLIEQLQKFEPTTEVILPVYNNTVETYGFLDNVHECKYGQIYNDFFGTPAPMDKRLFDPKFNDETEICLLSSLFPIKYTL